MICCVDNELVPMEQRKDYNVWSKRANCWISKYGFDTRKEAWEAAMKAREKDHTAGCEYIIKDYRWQNMAW